MLVLDKNSKSLQNAIAKAKKEQPRVRMVEYGRYEVTTGHSKYEVECKRDDQGRKLVHCTCRDEPNRKETECYHLPPAIQLHSIMAATRKEIKNPPPMCECGKPGYACHNNKWWCIDCIKGALRDGLESLGELDEARTWEKDQEAAEAEAESDAYREMLERDRLDIFGSKGLEQWA
jgi:hypothetical protein